jgi:pimeloyl-ACP methyl ester carboxylesterase
LHGYLSSSKSFAYQTGYFTRYFNVHAIDLKGFGQNKDMQYPYSLDDYVNDVERYIKENGLKTPHVIAHSFGARIALKLAYKNPNAFDKMVLTGAAGLKPRRTLKFYLKKFSFKFCALFVKKEKLKRFYSSDYRELSPIMQKSFIKIVNENLDYTLHGIKNKVFIVFGKNDKQTPLYMAKKLNKGIKNSKKLTIQNAGHFCFIDKPTTFNTEVREFLLSN